MKRKTILVLVLTFLFMTKISFGDMVSLSIENIGSLPIWGTKVTFDIAPRGLFIFPDLSYDCGVIFRSSAYPWPPLNEPLTPFDRDEPIAPGETYYSPVIPQLENVTFSVKDIGFNGPYVYIGGSQHYREVVLDQSFITEDPWDGQFAATLRFHSVVPVNAGGPYFLDIGDSPIMLDGSVEGAISKAVWDLNLDGLFDDSEGLQPFISVSMLESWGFSPGMTWDIGLQVTGLNGAVNTSMTQLTFTPVPSAVILGSIGLTFTGWLLKRKRMM